MNESLRDYSVRCASAFKFLDVSSPVVYAGVRTRRRLFDLSGGIHDHGMGVSIDIRTVKGQV